MYMAVHSNVQDESHPNASTGPTAPTLAQCPSMATIDTPAASQPGLIRHRNHFLFSDYYLDNRVRERPEWRAADAQAAFGEITNLWRAYRPEQANEAQTEVDWIRPVLRLLGHAFNVQVPIQTPLGARKPDYVLFPDEAARTAALAKSGVLSEDDLADAIAVADAKAWDRPLDRALRLPAGRAAPAVSENPSFQIDFYMRHTGLPWGLLTNGRLWRLYHRDTSKKLDVFYEVDLPALHRAGRPRRLSTTSGSSSGREAFAARRGAGWRRCWPRARPTSRGSATPSRTRSTSRWARWRRASWTSRPTASPPRPRCCRRSTTTA